VGYAFKGWQGREANREWIRFVRFNGPWDWFTSHTFRTDRMSNETAVILYRKYLNKLNRALVQRYKRKGKDCLRWILVVERKRHKRPHLHSLIKAEGLGELNRFQWSRRWESVSSIAGYSRIHEANNQAAPYIMKYVVKDQAGEIWLSNGLKFQSPED